MSDKKFLYEVKIMNNPPYSDVSAYVMAKDALDAVAVFANEYQPEEDVTSFSLEVSLGIDIDRVIGLPAHISNSEREAA